MVNNHSLSKGHLAIKDNIFGPSGVRCRGAPQYSSRKNYILQVLQAWYATITIPTHILQVLWCACAKSSATVVVLSVCLSATCYSIIMSKVRCLTVPCRQCKVLFRRYNNQWFWFGSLHTHTHTHKKNTNKYIHSCFTYQWEFFLKRQCQLFHEYPQPLDARKFHDQFDQGYNQAASLSQHYGQESKENDVM